ncbi:MAG TPA: PaaX family transcriptional regulator C-terminal domain-containing protein [Streptosporangiaceae bacterium]
MVHVGTEPARSNATKVGLPRLQSGTSPQHLLLTLLGDYWYGRAEHLPSAALVAIAEEFGVSAVGARAALSRLARRGLLESSKIGRRTYYGLTEHAAEVLTEGAQHIMMFGVRTLPWDGGWTVAAFSLPEEQRDLRHVVRTRLRWLGFAPLYDGVWVSPRVSADAAERVLDELNVTGATVFRSASGIRGRSPIAAWDLADLRTAYEDFIAKFEPLLTRIRLGSVGTTDALLARTSVMDTWRVFPGLDPELPAEVLPADWPRARAREVFVEVYDTLGPLAEIRIRQVLAEFAADLAGFVRHHTTSSVFDAP